MMYVIAIYTQELKPEDVINMVEKLTSSYYDALSFILTAISIILAFAVWDRSTMKKAIQKEFEAKLEKETEKIKQEIQTKVDELLEKANKAFDKNLEQSNEQMWDLSILIDNKAILRNQTSYTNNMIVHPSLTNYSKLAHVKRLTTEILGVLNHIKNSKINELLHEEIQETFVNTALEFNNLIKILYQIYTPYKDSTEDRKKIKQKIKAINDTIDNINAKIADYPYFKDMDVTELYLKKIDKTKLFAGSKQSKPNKTNPS